MIKSSSLPHTGPQQEKLLVARNLHLKFKAQQGIIWALNTINLEIESGKITGLVGVDGAGKTTLMRCGAGLLRPTSGSISVFGLDSVRDTLEIQSAVGYMPQRFGLYQDLTVIENMDLYADLQGVDRKKRASRYERLLEMTRLTPYLKRRAGALSGGMKQKLGLMCALIKSPRLLLLDEPTVGVDPLSRRELWKILFELVNDDGIGVFVSTAYLDEAEDCHQVIILHEGQILEEAPPHTFMERMKDRVFTATPPATVSPRRLYSRLVARKDIVDTTIRSGKVHLVFAEKPRLPAYAAHFCATTPCFEDAFMARIPPHRPENSLKATDPGDVPLQTRDTTVIQIEELAKSFGSFVAVDKLSFEVKQGEIFGLLGPNGAGKSTTFRILCGLLPASSGQIRVAGYDLRRSRAKARARLGYMAQQFSLYGQLSTEENLRFFGKSYGLRGSHLGRRISWAYEEFGLAPYRSSAAASLPGGYKQRLAMAAALLHEPDILFLDEPTSGVDPFARREFWLRINGFAEAGVTIIVTTHFMEEAEYCDRMLIMSEGRTLAMGTPAQIRALTQTPDHPEPTMEDAFIALAENQGTTGRKNGAGRL